jgi:hypothetical protein
VHLSANYRRHRTAHLKASMHSMQSCGLADCEEEEGREARQGRAGQGVAWAWGVADPQKREP